MKIIRMKTHKPLLPYILVGILVLTLISLGVCAIVAMILPVPYSPNLLWSMSYYTLPASGLYFIAFFVFEFFHRERPERGSFRKDYQPPPKKKRDVTGERRVPWEWSLLFTGGILLNATILLSLLSVL